MDFIGRTSELATLNAELERSSGFVVIYGRRRVGKTTLIKEFIKDKRAFYYLATTESEAQSMKRFAGVLSRTTKNPMLSKVTFTDWLDLFQVVADDHPDEKKVLVIDEFPYLVKTNPDFPSILQNAWDEVLKDHNVMLILCGSSMSYMEDHVLAYKAPLYGRRTAQLKVQPFEFMEACKHFPKFAAEDKAIAYGIVGGTPQYLLQLDDGLSIKENIKKIFLNPSSFLFEEPTNLLKQEVREPAIYNAIITAIATGGTKLSEISSKVGEDTSVCATYIRNLISLGIVKKETPYGESSGRKTIYSIEDNMFRFWYRFVAENTSVISRGADELAYKRIEPYLSDYMGAVFEDISKQHLWNELLNDNCPVNFTDIGRWWGTNKKTRQQEEIDIMGVQDKTTALFGECKWTNEKVDLAVLEKLIERSELFNYKNKHFYLFAKSGFTKGCIRKAEEMGNVRLVEYSEMLKEVK